MSHGQRWNLRKISSFSCQLQVNAARGSHFFDDKTRKFTSLSMGVHGTLRYLSVTFINSYLRTCLLRRSVNYLPSISYARYTRQILQTGKVHRIRESPSFPKKSIVYTRPGKTVLDFHQCICYF